MSEMHNYCDAPNGPCLIVNERNATQLLSDRTKAHAALLNIYFVAKNKSGDEPESVLSAIECLAKKALHSLSNIEIMITEEKS